MIVVLAIAASLLAFLIGARIADSRRQARLLHDWGALTTRGRRVLDLWSLPIEDQRFALDICARAEQARDIERLKAGVRAVEAFAPSVHEGLASMRDLARAIAAVTPVPAVRPSLWQSARLRALTGAAALLHAVLVSAAERVSLRLWLLGRVLSLCVRWLRGAAWSPRGPIWSAVRANVTDLRAVGLEAELTYRHVVRCLDAIGALHMCQS